MSQGSPMDKDGKPPVADRTGHLHSRAFKAQPLAQRHDAIPPV